MMARIFLSLLGIYSTSLGIILSAQAQETPIVEDISPRSSAPMEEVKTRTFGGDQTSSSVTPNVPSDVSSASLSPSDAPTLEPEPPDSVELSDREKDFGPKNQTKSLSLRQVIEQGLRENIDQKVREYAKSIIKINWRDAWEKYWLPDTHFFLEQNPQKIHRIYDAPSIARNQEGHTRTGNGAFGLALGEYSVFNWGKDYLQYLNDEVTYDRGNDYLDEQKRDLKHSLIEQYFRLAYYKYREKIYKEQLKHTTFIYRMARERAQLKRIGRQEYLEARAEYLLAQNEYHQVRVEAVGEDENMANLLGDTLDTSYYVSEDLVFKKVNLLAQDAISYALSKNSDLLNQKARMQIEQRKYDLALTDTLPLPKFTVDLGTYSYDWTKNGLGNDYKTSNTTGRVELVASLNATWPIFGEGGFFKTRSTYRDFLEKRIEEEKFYDVKRRVELKIRSLYRSLIFQENKVEITSLRIENSQKNFDATLDNYVAGRARFTELKDSLDELKQASTEFESSKFEHLMAKLNLAKEIGQEDFPGENFESLARSKDGNK